VCPLRFALLSLVLSCLALAQTEPLTDFKAQVVDDV
jgi:hypothetical protein